jgi:hypothetical protein
MKIDILKPVTMAMESQNNLKLILALIYLLFLVFVAMYVWFNLGCLLAFGKLPLWDFIKNLIQ